MRKTLLSLFLCGAIAGCSVHSKEVVQKPAPAPTTTVVTEPPPPSSTVYVPAR